MTEIESLPSTRMKEIELRPLFFYALKTLAEVKLLKLLEK